MHKCGAAPVPLPGLLSTAVNFAKEGQPIYLLWSDQGERTVDLSGELGARARVTDAAGMETTMDANALPLTEEPLLAQREQ